MNKGEQIKNMRLIGRSDLNGFGNGGEGIALRQLPGGRRILYIAHEQGPKDFTVLDVTNPAEPKVIIQTDLPHNKIRSNSLAMVDDILLVAYQSMPPEPRPDVLGVKPVGMGVFDVSDVEHPRQIAFFDTSGPNSRGTHCLWFVDGRYAHLSTGMPDFVPTDIKDDQFYVIVDLADPTKPQEVGRWWFPGTRQGDSTPPPLRLPQFDRGYRTHNTNVYPQRPDRAYVGYLDGGVVILDIADLSQPKMVTNFKHHPPFPGFTHTVLPLFDRDLLIVTDEAVLKKCEDWPKLVWVMDARVETNLIPISTFPMPSPEDYRFPNAWMGAHNLHENEPLPTALCSSNIIVGTFFSAGVRVFDISNPFRPEEVAYYVPQTPEGAPPIWINDVYVDERGLIYAIDRGNSKTGLYILEMTI